MAIGTSAGDTSREKQARDFLEAVSVALCNIDETRLTEVIDTIEACILSGRLVTFLGNGGSAATASHLVTDILLAARLGDFSANVVAPQDNSSLVTALANDIGFAEAGAIIVERTMSKGDLLVVFSGSGQSANLLSATTAARQRGIETILIGAVAAPDNFPAHDRFLVDSDYYSVIETVHCAVAHVIADRLRKRFGVDLARTTSRSRAPSQ